MLRYVLKGLACSLAVFVFSFHANAQIDVHFAYQFSSNYPFQVGEGLEVPEEKPGVAVEIIQHVAQALSLNLQLSRVPWKRGLAVMEAGEIDGVFNASYKKGREKFGAYPMRDGQVDSAKRSYSNSYSLFRSKSSPLEWDGKTFNHNQLNIATTLGFSIAEDLRKLGINVHETVNVVQALQSANLGRTDAVALLTPSGESLIRNKTLGLDNIEQVEPVLKTKDYFLMLSHQFIAKHPDLAKQIWMQIESFRNSKAFPLLFDKYYGVNGGAR